MYAETSFNKTRRVTEGGGGSSKSFYVARGEKWCKSGTEGSKKTYASEGRGRGRREDFQSSNNFTTSLCFPLSARERGVRPNMSCVSGLAPPSSSSSCTTLPGHSKQHTLVGFGHHGLACRGQPPAPATAALPPRVHYKQPERAAFARPSLRYRD